MVALPQENDRHEPLPSDPLGQRLCLTFPYLWQAIVGVNETKPQWQTVTKYPLRPRVLWRLWQDPAQLVGVRFDDQTRYGLIDIDAESLFHPRQQPEALPTLKAALETIGIFRTVLIRSSWSGGLHLYIPLSESVPTFGFASALKQCLEVQDIPVAQGQVEIFPNCKSYATPGHYTEYNGHRLPLQPHAGACLLDEDCNPVSQDLERFFQQWDSAAAAQDMAQLRESISTARQNRRGRRQRQTTIVEEWRQDLRAEMGEGWTDYGQTNHLLKTIACYGVVFEGLKGDALAEFVYESAIQSPGFAQWCRHQSDIKLKAMVWARAAEGYYWRLGDERTRGGSFQSLSEPDSKVIPISQNLLRSQDAQRRIEAAVSDLSEQGILAATPTARAKQIAEHGSISLKTLYRHPELWHPDQIEKERFLEQEASPTGKIPQPEETPAIGEGGLEGEADLPKSSESGKFYTLAEQMKGGNSEMGLDEPSGSLEARRPSMTNFSPEGSTAARTPNVIQLSFPDVLANLSDGYQVEMSCTEAIRRGDRDWVLQRLIVLWSEGHRDLIEVLCRLHPNWGFAVSESGVVEVESDALQR